MNDKIKIIVTLGPSTNTIEDLKKIKDKNVDFIRINMSHSSVEDLKKYIKMAKEVGIPFIIDTEGSQIRTGNLIFECIEFEENQEVKIYSEEIIGDGNKISLKPGFVIEQLEEGDIIYIDFDTFALRVSDISTMSEGYITAKAVTAGTLGRNKAVAIDHASEKRIILPPLSEKDYQSIQIGLEEGVNYIAASFMRSGKFVDEVRKATQNSMKIISKIECIDALENLDEIAKKSDYLLIDRGDLSKEVPIEKIPFLQKIIINRAQKWNAKVFVATNLLETMITKRKPTRAEIHDVLNTIVDGAYGLTLAAETAIGKYPMECINMLNKLIKHSELLTENSKELKEIKNELMQKLEEKNYLLDSSITSSLIPPHGGKLINRLLKELPEEDYLKSLPKIKIDENKHMDAEQIAIGAYSPLEGFMGKEDLQNVLDNMRLTNGIIWSIPIILDISQEESSQLAVGEDVALINEKEEAVVILHLEEKYHFDKEEIANKLYGTNSLEHPGVQMVKKMKPVLLAGKINLIQRRKTETKEYELTPRQTRRIFDEKGWAKVVGFHTRNVIHRGHEFIQLNAIRKENCDGLFVHPIVGKKKVGDYHTKYIINSYEIMKKYYPRDKVVFSTFSTYSRYAGPREALFTAICRKNFGCSHFIVGRDHTGVKNFYHPKAAHTIFERFPDIGIKAVCFDEVFYSQRLKRYVHEKEMPAHPEEDKLRISGTQARKMFEQGVSPPEWFMHPEISQMILDSIKKGEEVFIKEE